MKDTLKTKAAERLTSKLDKLFPDIVGQWAPKKKSAFFLDTYESTHVFPNALYVAPRGNGKTTLARATAKCLTMQDEDKPKPFVEINCSTLKNLKQFMNQVMMPHVQDKEVTVLFDEASEIPNDLTMALLTMLNPNPTNQNTFSYDDYDFLIDFRKHTFLFATTEAQDVFHALKDRLERIELEDYSRPDLAKIMMRRLKRVSVNTKLQLEIAQVMRGNARQADVMGGHIEKYCTHNKTKTFTEADWASLKDSLGILPLGVSEIELRVLKILYLKAKDTVSDEGVSLTQLSSVTDMSRESLQRDVERYLLKNGLMEIGPRGREITPKGTEYIKELIKMKLVTI